MPNFSTTAAGRTSSAGSFHSPGKLERRYRAAGYRDTFVDVDHEVCQEVGCEGCRRPSTVYVGLRGPDGDYRALSRCPACGLEVEF